MIFDHDVLKVAECRYPDDEESRFEFAYDLQFELEWFMSVNHIEESKKKAALACCLLLNYL